MRRFVLAFVLVTVACAQQHDPRFVLSEGWQHDDHDRWMRVRLPPRLPAERLRAIVQNGGSADAVIEAVHRWRDRDATDDADDLTIVIVGVTA